MNKSHLSHANNSHPVVTPHDIGNFVKVSGVGTGILRYVGPIHGKDGLFCGIELDHAIGKHDGTFQGVSYFVCPPERGIFAPLYKVELDEPDDVPMMSLSQIGRGTERLSRSALPALQLKNVARPEDPMTTSIFSHNSMMDTSAFSQVSWGDITDMCASNTTYVIPPGKGMFDEEDDLMTVEAPQSVVAIDRDAIRREEERLLGASYVVEKPHFAKERLPVVEDDEDETDLITPMVENRPLTEASEASWNVSQESEPNPGSNAENEQEEDAPENDNTPAATTPPKAKVSPRGKMQSEETKQPAVVEKKPQKKVEEPPAAPKFPVKPKAPTKHQLMMQQLKASIEADKTKPKKEIKARVPLIPPPLPPKQKENEGDKAIAETPKRMLKQPLKAVNETPKAAPVERPKKERKPLYVPPPPKEKVEKKEPPSKPSFVPVTKKAPSRESVNQEKKEKAKTGSQFPTSSFAGGKLRTSSSSTTKSAQNVKKSIAESEKLARLLNANTASIAFALTAQHLSGQKRDLAKRLAEVEGKLVEEQKNSENLRTRLGQVEKKHKEDVERMKSHTEQLTKSHAETIERLKSGHEIQLSEKAKETEKSIEDEKHRHEAEMEAMDRRHQKVIIALDEKIAESEKIAEQLKADKKSLQQALANDSDQRNQMLTKEINSLQTALELKNNEMKELRQKYQQVALRVEEIPLKELEITKLKHKVTELKQSLDQKLTYERLLVNQNEELKRQQLVIEEEKDSMKRSIDVMMYHYENGEDPMTSSRHSSTPGKVTFRSRSSNSSHRPNSGIPPEARLSMSSCAGEMDRSVDARDSLTRSTISMYASQYKLPENHAEDVIYAPDQIIAGGSITSSLSEEDALLHVNGNETDPQTDSGIVLS